MNEIKYNFFYDDLEKDLLPRLKGEVFHVTSIESYNGILKSRYIDPNTDGIYQRNWECDCYGRKRGFVCLFDLRSLPIEKINLYRVRCDFIYDSKFGETSAYLMLAGPCYKSIIPNNVAVDETNHREYFVPHIEAWFPGRLQLNNIDKVLIVKKTISPPAAQLNER